MVSWGDFNGFYFVVNGAPRLGGASWTYPTTLMVRLMVEKSTFIAPPAADVARRAIPALARYREPSHSRSIFEIVVTLVPFVALWALAWQSRKNVASNSSVRGMRQGDRQTGQPMVKRPQSGTDRGQVMQDIIWPLGQAHIIRLRGRPALLPRFFEFAIAQASFTCVDYCPVEINFTDLNGTIMYPEPDTA